MNTRLALAVTTALLAATPLANAQDAGDWEIRAGAHRVVPKSDNSSIVNVDAATSVTFSATYMVAPNWGIELLAALPFEHDVNLNGGGEVATVKHLPPTLSAQYHFNPNGRVRPYVGAGLNYTLFFDEDTTGALRGAKLELDGSLGLAAQAGIDFSFGTDWFLSLDGRYIDIDTDAKLNGADLVTVEIDPFTYGLSIGRRF